MLDKKVITRDGKKLYLLGRGKDGLTYFLQEPTWDCGWYWGFGYVEGYTKNARSWRCHTHFDSLFFSADVPMYQAVAEFFEDVTFTEPEMWRILELMKSGYQCRSYADMIHCGSSNITKNPVDMIIKNEDEYCRINHIVIPEIWKELVKILKAD